MAGYSNYQVDRNKHKKGFNIFKKGNNTRKNNKSQRLMDGIGVWTSFYRANPQRFVSEYLGINLKIFQEILLYAMITNYYFMYLASRGQGKTFLTSIYCVTRAILYPGTKIVVASGNKSQAREVIEKIEEMMGGSPNLQREIKDLKSSVNDARITFHNGSWIKTVASNDGARSKRANLLIVDEFRMVDKGIVDKVLRKFLSAPRQPGYLDKEEYKNDPELEERNMEMYLSSAYYTHHWSYNKFLTFVNQMVKGSKYFVCGLPYQVAIKEGLYNKEQARDEMSEDDFDEVGWDMEMGCMWFGESAKAYFKFDDLNLSRTSAIPYYHSETYNLLTDGKFKRPNKEKDEIRLLSCDIAASEGSANDNSVFSVIKLVKNGNTYNRHIVYMESINGGNTVTQSFRIRDLYEDFKCDYIVLDTQNVGMAVYDNLILDQFDRETSKEYKALSCINDDVMARRCKIENAPKVIYSIKASAKLNSDIAINFRDNLRRGKIKLLVHENDAGENLRKFKGFDKLSVEEKTKLLQPYAQTSSLINEMIGLEASFNDNGEVKLKEPPGKRKDKWSSVSYGNWIATQLERDLIVYDDNVWDNQEFIIT